MAYGAWGQEFGNKPATFNEATSAQVAEYKRHVKNGTVPSEAKIPYSFQAPKPFEFVPGAKPVYPAWTMTKAGVQAAILKFQKLPGWGKAVKHFDDAYPIPRWYEGKSTVEYVEEFNRARNLKS